MVFWCDSGPFGPATFRLTLGATRARHEAGLETKTLTTGTNESTIAGVAISDSEREEIAGMLGIVVARVMEAEDYLATCGTPATMETVTEVAHAAFSPQWALEYGVMIDRIRRLEIRTKALTYLLGVERIRSMKWRRAAEQAAAQTKEG